MELCVTLLHLAALLSLAGSTRGDDVDPTGCIAPRGDHRPTHVRLNDMALRCLSLDSATAARVSAVDTLDGRKTFFKDLCDQKQQVPGCLAPVTYTAMVCGSEAGSRFYMISRHLLEALPDIVCVRDGELLAEIFTTYNVSQTPSFKRDRFHDCADTALARIVRLMDEDVAPHYRLFMIYREVVKWKECVGKINDGDVTLMKAIESVLGAVSDEMKCIHPQGERTVPCRDIDVVLGWAERVCPLGAAKHPLRGTLLGGLFAEYSPGGGERSLQADLLNSLSWCLTSTLLDQQSLNAIDTLESSWDFLVHNCAKRATIRTCVSDVATLSSVCLSDAQHDVFRLFEDAATHALDSLCVVDSGYSVGYVLYKVLTKSGATVQHNDIRECLNIARPQRSRRIDPADFLRFYQELKVFRACLINKLHGDNRAVFDAHLFLSSVERKMKCLDPVLGTMVLCEDINRTPPTETSVCPLTGRNPQEPPKYDRLVDMSILCLKAATLELDPVKNFTTLEQFQTFFTSFCHNRRAVERCLGDLSSLSRACLTVTDRELFTAFTDLYGRALEAGCREGGEVFATIMTGLFVAEADLTRTCVVAASERLATYVTESVHATIVFHYQLLAGLRQCVLDGAADAGAFKTVFTSYTGELLRGIKMCVHPESGALVTC